MKRRLMIFLPLLVVACGSETTQRSHNDYASGPLPTAAAVQAEAVLEQQSPLEAVVKETIISRRLTSEGTADPAAHTEEFSRGDEIHLAVKIEPQSATASEVRVTWYGPDDALVAEDAQTLPGTDRPVSFSTGKTTDWNPGMYRAEVWLGNQKLTEQRFALAPKDGATLSDSSNES